MISWRSGGAVAVLMMLVAGAAILLGGCSRAAMDSHPFASTHWMSETGVSISPTRDAPAARPDSRINLWPIYYQRGPAWSAVWPLVASSPHGSAVIPFYEFLRADHHLRLGVIHQWVPSLFDKNGSRQSWRFLNVERIGKTKAFNIYPFFWHKPEYTFLFPLYYGDHKGYWTPLVMNRDGTQGVLGPLFLRSRKDIHGSTETKYWYPFPLARHWSSTGGYWGNQLFPLWYWRFDSPYEKHFNLAGILLDYQRTGVEGSQFKYLLPLGKIERAEENKKNYLIPFWYYNREGDRTQFLSWLNGYYLREGADKREVVHPFWIDMKAPGSRHIVALILLYHLHQDGPRRSWSVLWPIFTHYENERTRGHMLAPLYLYEREKDGPGFFVSPLLGFKTDGSVISILGPVYLHLRRPEGTQSAIFWPFIRWWNTDRERGHNVIPLWYRNVTPAIEGDTFMTLLFGWSRNKYGSFRHFLGPVYMAQDDEEHDFHWRSILFPIFHHIRNRDRSHNLLVPLAVHTNSPDHKAVYTIPLSAGRMDDRKFVNVLLFLAHWTASPRDAHFYIFVRLAGYHRLDQDDIRAWWAWPLIGWKRAGDTTKFGFLLDSIGYQRNPEKEQFKWWLGWFLIKYERGRVPEAAPLADGRTGVLTREFIWPLWRGTRWDRADQMDAFVAEFERLAAEGHVPDKFTQTLAASQPYFLDGRPLKVKESHIKLHFRAREFNVVARLREEGAILGANQRAATGAGGQPVLFDFGDVKESWFFPYLGYIPGLKGFGPMFYYLNDPRAAFQRRWFFGLWHSQKERELDGTVRFERQSLLSYLYSREREGARTSVDMFPFLSWDSDEGMRRFSFAAGLFETGRKDGKRSLKIFWIPLIKAE